MPTTYALWRSTCPTCDDAILEGDRIRMRSDGSWEHFECPDEEHRTFLPRAQRRPALICPVCFLEKPCACDS